MFSGKTLKTVECRPGPWREPLPSEQCFCSLGKRNQDIKNMGQIKAGVDSGFQKCYSKFLNKFPAQPYLGTLDTN